MQLNQMQNLEQRVRSYWYQDGIGEMAGGGMLFLLGVYFAVQGYFGEGSLVTGMLSAGMILVFLAGAYSVRKLVMAFKNRVTYPRTGFVEYRVDREQAKWRRYAAAVLAVGLAAALVAYNRLIRGLDLVVLVSGIMAGLILIVLRGRAAGLGRFYILGTLAILLGAGLSLSGLPQAYGLAVFYSLLGIALMISGGLVLRRYLHDNPMPAEASGGHGPA